MKSVGQRASKLQAVKVRGQKKNSATQPGAGEAGSNQAELHFDEKIKTFKKTFTIILRMIMKFMS